MSGEQRPSGVFDPGPVQGEPSQGALERKYDNAEDGVDVETGAAEHEQEMKERHVTYEEDGDDGTISKPAMSNTQNLLGKSWHFDDEHEDPDEPSDVLDRERSMMKSYGTVRSKSRLNSLGRPYEYSIQVTSWAEDMQEYEEERKLHPNSDIPIPDSYQYAMGLNKELVEIFGIDSVRALPTGKVDIRHGYFKISATPDDLELWAEEDKLRVRVKPWRGGGFRPYTRERRKAGMFAHAGCYCSSEEECVGFCCAAEAIDPAECKCLVLLPYQTQDLIRKRISQAFDNWYRSKARQAAKAKNQNVMTTVEDIHQFLNRFGKEKGLSADIVNRLKSVFHMDAEDFQNQTRLMFNDSLMNDDVLCSMKGLGDDLYEKVHAETEDDILIPQGKGLALAVKEKKVEKIYPLHTLRAADLYKSRREVLRDYCGWRTSAATVMSPLKKSREYLRFLRDYFGEKIALYFAFLHYYTTWLVPLAVVGILLAVSQWFSSFDNFGVILYSLFVAVWGTLMLEFWQRRNAELGFLWDMSHFEIQENELATYIEDKDTAGTLGFYEQHGGWVDMTEYSIHASKRMPRIRQFIRSEHRDTRTCLPSCFFFWVPGGPDAKKEFQTAAFRLVKEMFTVSCVATLIAIVSAITLALLYFRLVLQDVNEVFGGLVAGVLNALSIAVLDFAYEGIAVKLNNFENHRTATQYEDRLIAKQFVFQFVNSYFSLFYIAFFKGARDWSSDTKLFGREDVCKDLEGNTTDSCMAELSLQLTAMLLTRLVIGNVIEWAIPHYQLRANMWNLWRHRVKDIKEKNPELTDKQLERRMRKLGMSKEVVDVVEKQGHQPAYNQGIPNHVSGTFYDYAELAIQFGYVTIFAPAFPLAPLIGIISNIVENRNDGYKILLSCRKPDYQGAADMGTWLIIFQFLSFVAVITNCMLIAFTSRELDQVLDDPSLATRIFVVFLFEHAVLSLKIFIQYYIPVKPYWVRVQEARQNEIARAETAHREYAAWAAGARKSVDQKNKSRVDLILNKTPRELLEAVTTREHVHRGDVEDLDLLLNDVDDDDIHVDENTPAKPSDSNPDDGPKITSSYET